MPGADGGHGRRILFDRPIPIVHVESNAGLLRRNNGHRHGAVCTCTGGTWLCMFFCTAICDSGLGSDDAQPHDASPIDAATEDAASMDGGGDI